MESFRHTIELQSVVLPDTQNARRTLIGAIDVFEDRIGRLGDANEAVLIFKRTSDALLVLLELVQRHYARAEAQTNQLMPAADRKHRCLGLANKRTKVVQDRLLVIIKISQRPTQHDCVRRKTFSGFTDFG